MFGSCLCCYMNEAIVFFISQNLLVTIRRAIPLIHSIKFFVFNILGANFLAPKSGHRCENEPVLRSDTIK